MKANKTNPEATPFSILVSEPLWIPRLRDEARSFGVGGYWGVLTFKFEGCENYPSLTLQVGLYYSTQMVK